MAKLSVNINKIATLRNSRGTDSPNLIQMAKKIVDFGAEGITIHPRADRRHITPKDAVDVKKNITEVEVNFEGDIREEFLELVFDLKPTQCTLVPVKPGEITSNHGWELDKWGFLLKPVIDKLRNLGIRSSIFMHPNDTSSIPLLSKLQPDRIELFTEPFAHAFLFNQNELDKEIEKLAFFAQKAKEQGIGINAGHDLTHENLPVLLEAIPYIEEVSIGHHLISYAIEVGLEKAVQIYLKASNIN